MLTGQSVSGNSERQFQEVRSERKKQVEGSEKDTQPQAYTQAYMRVHIYKPILASTLHTTLVMYTNLFKCVNTFIF